MTDRADEWMKGKIDTTDGKVPETFDTPAPDMATDASGQHKAYWVLGEEERRKGWVRPYRESYVHEYCGMETRMGRAIAETYAASPSWYSSTYCTFCMNHRPVSEFLWVGTEERVGS